MPRPFVFFLITPPTPTSTLFPTRRSSDLEKLAYLTQTTLSVDETTEIIAALKERFPAMRGPAREDICRSEEHTSELQSQSNLVCRLLLEKKNFMIASSRSPIIPFVSSVTG